MGDKEYWGEDGDLIVRAECSDKEEFLEWV